MYKQAVREKLRWEFNGVLSVEDLMDLSIENLDYIYKGLRKRQKEEDEDSLIESKEVGSRESEILAVKISIVRDIFSDKIAERMAARTAALRKQKAERLMSLIAQKEDAELMEKSADELKTLLADLV